MKLWKNNRIDQEWELSTEEIVAGFVASKWNHTSLPLDRLLRAYITARPEEGGLSSVFDEDEYGEVYEEVLEARRDPNMPPRYDTDGWPLCRYCPDRATHWEALLHSTGGQGPPEFRCDYHRRQDIAPGTVSGNILPTHLRQD